MTTRKTLRKTPGRTHPASCTHTIDPNPTPYRKEAKDRARILAIRYGRPHYVRKYSFHDMPPAYETCPPAEAPDDPVFTARPVDAQFNPKWFDPERYVQKVRAGLYWAQMERVCEETEPPTDTIKAKHARRLWDRDPGILVALRKWKALGEKPAGRYRWVTPLLKNDVVGALEKGSKYGQPGSGTPDDIYAVLEFLRNRWNGSSWSSGPTGLCWGDESTVFDHSHRGGDLTHYSYPGLSSPKGEILRQYQIMRRFQEPERECRQVLREKFGFDFIDRRR